MNVYSCKEPKHSLAKIPYRHIILTISEKVKVNIHVHATVKLYPFIT